MEDFILVDTVEFNETKYKIFAIFDGHGGHEVSLYLKNNFSNFFLEALKISESVKTALLNCFLAIDDSLKDNKSMLAYKSTTDANETEEDQLFRILFELESIPEFNLANFTGSCACVVILTGYDLFIANLGDSRAVLLNSESLINLNYSHLPELDEEQQRINDAGFEIADGRIDGVINVSRAIGDFTYKTKGLESSKTAITAEPFIKQLTCQPKDTVVISSDGMFEYLDGMTKNELLSIFEFAEETVPALFDKNNMGDSS